MARIETFARDDAGAALAEYGMILGVLTVVGGLAITTLGAGTRDRLDAAGEVANLTDTDTTPVSATDDTSCPGRSCEARGNDRAGGLGKR